MVDWPSNLPVMLAGLTDKRQSTTIRSEVDSGPPIVRRRFTAAVRTLTIPMRFTNAERATFDTFFNTTLAGGSLSFNWLDPVTDALVAMRFVEPPEFTGEDGGAFKYWTATFVMEILP